MVKHRYARDSAHRHSHGGFGKRWSKPTQSAWRTTYKLGEVESQAVRTAFFKLNEVALLEASCEDSPIARFIAERARLGQAAFSLLDHKPEKGADDQWVAFLQPEETHELLIELRMENE